jgi:hypothetical protein
MKNKKDKFNPHLGVKRLFEPTEMGTCTKEGTHEYAEITCQCGTIFCWSCCRDTNVHEGGKYQPSYMICPICGTDCMKTN